MYGLKKVNATSKSFKFKVMLHLNHRGNLILFVLSFFTIPLYAWSVLEFSSEVQAKFLSLGDYCCVKSASAFQTLKYALKELYLQSVIAVYNKALV